MTDFSLVFHIFLVADENEDDIWLALIHHLVVPSVQVNKGVESRYIVAQKDAVGSAVKDLGDTLERLLASCVPYLKLEHLQLQLDKECSEFDSNSHFMVRQKLVVGEAMQHARFAYRRVPDDNKLEEEVLVLH